jgi:hypothetical protein
MNPEPRNPPGPSALEGHQDAGQAPAKGEVPGQRQPDPAERAELFGRRALIRAGWTFPLVLAVEAALPGTAQAGTFSNSGNFNKIGGFNQQHDLSHTKS